MSVGCSEFTRTTDSSDAAFDAGGTYDDLRVRVAQLGIYLYQ